jgi:hypothetical protein
MIVLSRQSRASLNGNQSIPQWMLIFLKREFRIRSREQVPHPHLPFDPFKEKGESHQGEPPPHLPGEIPPQSITQSGRGSSPPERFTEMVYTMFDNTVAVKDQYELQKEAENLIAFAASRGDPDTLAYNEAM